MLFVDNRCNQAIYLPNILTKIFVQCTEINIIKFIRDHTLKPPDAETSLHRNPNFERSAGWTLW